ncbi:Conserved hypothetical protein [Clostridium acetobutylicum EA 2018]|uniref:Uncharacterized protein n=1 Tax=Clostridium acetobutylicum (strain ATCC 824 / DSM 792 / JCM 1419 / IAM 19013 / LMG 5710 / NBRC 13948 / NRRL B-527 / VKM B-1787 / 2291 / W) TaxID=272562 RepID=Q97M11_CLOAB|nr:Hypothetical protein CA_C0389 [Clostridium acetobutylicum ATCC 824]ADZ19438.1 Conserved hypothetical protein [Clostridium acetobutylicum EA 2018]AEI31213.1 hypothetical protein SMB_G0397 [Clostridium acetobutylicum DSM 1731]
MKSGNIQLFWRCANSYRFILRDENVFKTASYFLMDKKQFYFFIIRRRRLWEK